MENIKQTKDVEQTKNPLCFNVFDWIVLIGAMIILPIMLGNGVMTLIIGKVDNFTQLIAGLFWITISAWALKLKLKKFKKIKTAKAYKILTIAVWVVAALILLSHFLFLIIAVIHF